MAAKRYSGSKMMRPDALATKLQAAANRYGSAHSLQISLCAASTALVAMGVPAEIRQAFLTTLAGKPTADMADDVRQVWKVAVHAAGYLDGFISPIVGWLEDPRDDDLRAFAACLTVLAETDLDAMLDDPLTGGELLGPLYTFLRANSSRKALGAFFTPAPVMELMAAMTPASEGSSFYEPACGAGGAMVAMVRVMRSQGLDPSTVRWHLNDLDATAVALSGVNALIHGLPHVVLTCQDALTLQPR